MFWLCYLQDNHENIIHIIYEQKNDKIHINKGKGSANYFFSFKNRTATGLSQLGQLRLQSMNHDLHGSARCATASETALAPVDFGNLTRRESTASVNTGNPGYLHDYYTYENLSKSQPEIRLVMLAPGKDRNAPVLCNLVKTDWKKRLKFEALSYTWGDENETRNITINGRHFQVTVNLFTALLHLRFPSVHRTLWIDAVCINQHDDKEKSDQLSFIREIYAGATSVLVWLGLSDADIDTTMAYFAESDRAGGISKKQANDESQRYYIPRNEHERAKFLPGLEKLLKRSWFTRVWVVQELLVARRAPMVGCGDVWVSWENFKQASWVVGIHGAFNTHYLPNTHDPLLIEFGFLCLAIEKKGREEDFERIIVATSDRECKDPRDRIFAILGLASRQIQRSISPDYELSTRSVFQLAMFATLKSHKDLEFLHVAVTVQSEDGLGVPSWCVDFTRVGWLRLLEQRGKWPLRSHKENACKGIRRYKLEHNLPMGHLLLEGAMVGTVNYVKTLMCGREFQRHISERMGDEANNIMVDETKKFIAEVRECSPAAYSALSSRLGDSNAKKLLQSGVVWNTLVRGASLRDLDDCWRNAKVEPPKDYSLHEMIANNDSAAPWAAPTSVQDDLFTSTTLTPLQFCLLRSFMGIVRLTTGHDFITTDTGYIARSDPGVRVGDLLCLLFGCWSPAVLRPCGVKESGEQLYELIAFTYTHDAMKGEFLKSRNFKRQNIVLK